MNLFSPETLLYLMSNGFRVYVIFLFFEALFQKNRAPKRRIFIGFFGYFLLNSVVFLYYERPLINLIVNLVFLFGLTNLYNIRIKLRIFSIMLVCILDLVCESIVYWFLTGILGGSYPTTGFVAPDLLMLFFVVVLQKLLEIKHGNRISLWQFFCIISVPIASIFIVAVILWEMPNNYLDVATTVVILLMNVVIFRLSNIIEGYYRQEYQLAVQQKQKDIYKSQIILQRDVAQWLKQFRHDMKNHLIALRHLVDSGRYEELSQYIDDMGERIEVKGEYAQSGNFTVDGILNVKLHEAKQIGSELTLEVTIPKRLGICEIDLNIILGNLLDNAITALSETSDRRLSVKLECDRNVLFIGVSNTYGGTISERNGFFFTTKESKIEHGFGLASVRSVVERYQGELKLQYDGCHFFATVVLYMKETRQE